ncbi:MAG: hypothetical protein RL020_1786 [Pseudomonadota bacterium]|jgi:hypothetical protein
MIKNLEQVFASSILFVILGALVVTKASAQTRDTPKDKPASATFSMSVNPEFATGKYGGSSDIEDRYFGLGLRYETKAWTFKTTLPYLQTSSDRAFTRVDQGQIHCRRSGTECTQDPATTTTGVEKKTKSGLGDVGASATYHLPEMSSGLNLDLIGRGKFNTASASSGMGSGRNDLSLASGVSYDFKSWEPYSELGYKWRGKSDDPDLLNQAFVVVGAKFFVGNASSLDLSYDFRAKSYADEPAAKSVSLSLASRFDRNWKLEAYYIHGLSEVVADKVIGISTGYRF